MEKKQQHRVRLAGNKTGGSLASSEPFIYIYILKRGEANNKTNARSAGVLTN